MDNNEKKYFKGKCLVATPSLDDERFKNTLIYICAHSEQGAMGFVINRKITEYSFSDLALQLPINFGPCVPPLALYHGGPVDKIRGFVLHSTDYLLLTAQDQKNLLLHLGMQAGLRDNLNRK